MMHFSHSPRRTDVQVDEEPQFRSLLRPDIEYAMMELFGARTHPVDPPPPYPQMSGKSLICV